eukprot:m.1082965 g.1082965  ORF g.1082965 m.1082965 type:complete len:274 (-) comp24268_c1_seq1:3640-4461(-)
MLCMKSTAIMSHLSMPIIARVRYYSSSHHKERNTVTCIREIFVRSLRIGCTQHYKTSVSTRSILTQQRILSRVADVCGHRICIDERKYRVLQTALAPEGDAFMTKHFTQSDGSDTPIWHISWGKLGVFAPGGWEFRADYPWLHQQLEKEADRFDRIVAFVPTGWTYAIGKQQRNARDVDRAETMGPNAAIPYAREAKGNVVVYTVPYSEHSSFPELRAFVKNLHPRKVIPTVVPGNTRAARRRLEEYFGDLVDEAWNRREFVSSFAPSTGYTL